jgi:hypothetical protein
MEIKQLPLVDESRSTHSGSIHRVVGKEKRLLMQDVVPGAVGGL